MEVLRSVYKKPFSEKLSGFILFWTSYLKKVYTDPTMRWKLFSLIGSNGVSTKSVFSYWDQKCIFDLRKKGTRKKFCPKTRFFWLKLFLMHFLRGHMYIFEISTVRKDGYFDALFDLFKEKSFRLLEGTMNLFENLKGQKRKKPLNISKNGFNKQILNFRCASKVLCLTSKLWNFVKITGT